MNRLGIGATAIALVALGACGGPGRGEGDSAAPPSSSPPKIALADACPKVQEALDESFRSEAVIDEPRDYAAFADRIAVLVDEVDAKGVPLLSRLQEVSATAGAVGEVGPELIEARAPWFDVMERVTDTCQQLGAPLS